MRKLREYEQIANESNAELKQTKELSEQRYAFGERLEYHLGAERYLAENP